MTKLIALVAAGLFVAGTMFAGEHGDCTKQVGNKQGKMACAGFIGQPQPDTRAEDEDGCGDGRACKSRLQRSERGQIHAGGKNNPDQGAVREVRSRVQEGDKDKTQT